MKHKTLLSININKLATLRNSRGHNNPDVVASTRELIKLGVRGITVHPRPDGRHIRRDDVINLKKAIDSLDASVEFNIEGFPSKDFLKLVEMIKPTQCTIVPDPPGALTSDAGWKIKENADLLNRVCTQLLKKKIRTSFFMDPKTTSEDELFLLKSFGAERIELYTERFAFSQEQALVNPAYACQADIVLKEYSDTAYLAQKAGLGINAGHDLSLKNLSVFLATIKNIKEVSIGHALICEALWLGFPETIKRYHQLIDNCTQATSY